MKQHRLLGLALAAIVLPFLLTGILIATKIAMWIAGTSADERSVSFLIAAYAWSQPVSSLAGSSLTGSLSFF
jgi:hypothetical protein